MLSITDLTLGNRPFAKWTIVDRNYATGSDHDITQWEVDMEKQQDAGGTQVIGRNLAAMSQEDNEQAE